MLYINLKLKNLLWLGIFIISVGAFFLPMNNLRQTFKVGDREIPIYSTARDDNKISLTFNCAWNDSDIDLIISLLKEYNADATFFIVGEWAEKYPDALKKLSAAGYEIGNHSYNHSRYSKLSKPEIIKDMERSDHAIANVTGTTPHLFRGAYGEYNNDVVSACDETGRTYIQWSVDSLDYKASSPDEICGRVLKKVGDGDIILMHNGTEFTASALKTLLPTLSRNHTLVRVSDLIYKDNYTIDTAGRQHKK